MEGEEDMGKAYMDQLPKDEMRREIISKLRSLMKNKLPDEEIRQMINQIIEPSRAEEALCILLERELVLGRSPEQILEEIAKLLQSYAPPDPEKEKATREWRAAHPIRDFPPDYVPTSEEQEKWDQEELEYEKRHQARRAKIAEAACRLVEAIAEDDFGFGGGQRWEQLQQLWALHATDPTFTGLSRLLPPPEEREGDEWKRETED